MTNIYKTNHYGFNEIIPAGEFCGGPQSVSVPAGEFRGGPQSESVPAGEFRSEPQGITVPVITRCIVL